MKYKHALFLSPYTENTSSTAMSLFPPTGLEYVATSAKDLVGKITLLDLRHDKEFCDTPKLIDFIKREIDIICVTISWNKHYEEICKLLNLMPDNIPLVVGGYKATEKVEEIFATCPKVSIVVRGEGEDTIKEVVRGVSPEGILGISYRKDGRVVHNENRPLPDVNKVAPPDRSLRRNKYGAVLNGIRMTRATFDTILSSRGCPHNCKFCTFNLNPMGQKRFYTSRSPESVITEIESIPSDMILFCDDNFFVEPRRAEKICDEIIKRGIKKRFVAQTRIDVARHPWLLEKIARAGFKMLLLGIESPHDHILAAMNKGFTQKEIREYFSVLTKYPIFYHGNYIYGNIGETLEEMLYIPEFSKEIGVDSVAFSKLRADKYSPLIDVINKTPGYHRTDRGEVYSDAFSHATLKKIAKRMKFSYYRPLKLIKLGLKLVRVGFVNMKDLGWFLLVCPMLLMRLIAREVHKNRLGDSLKRIFIKNAF